METKKPVAARPVLVYVSDDSPPSSDSDSSDYDSDNSLSLSSAEIAIRGVVETKKPVAAHPVPQRAAAGRAPANDIYEDLDCDAFLDQLIWAIKRDDLNKVASMLSSLACGARETSYKQSFTYNGLSESIRHGNVKIFDILILYYCRFEDADMLYLFVDEILNVSGTLDLPSVILMYELLARRLSIGRLEKLRKNLIESTVYDGIECTKQTRQALIQYFYDKGYLLSWDFLRNLMDNNDLEMFRFVAKLGVNGKMPKYPMIHIDWYNSDVEISKTSAENASNYSSR